MIFPRVEDFSLQRIDNNHSSYDHVWEAKWKQRWYILGLIGVGSGIDYCYHGNNYHWYNPITQTAASTSTRLWLSEKLQIKQFFNKQK